jgi:hemoglobin
MTLYERLGGAEPVGRIVDELSRRLIDDPRLGPAFAQFDPELLRLHRTAYFSVILDGPEGYEGRSMREAHQPLGLSEADMAAFLVVLRGVLDDAGITDANTSAVLKAIERLKPAIVAAQQPRSSSSGPSAPTDRS